MYTLCTGSNHLLTLFLRKKIYLQSLILTPPTRGGGGDNYGFFFCRDIWDMYVQGETGTGQLGDRRSILSKFP